MTIGMEEPDFYICTIVDDKSLSCVYSLDNNMKKEFTLIDAIGFQCVTPAGFAKLKTHHEVLHEELNKKSK